jgi:hypothetical protein
MKALVVWQPWASLIVHGIKRFETRGWAPPRSLIGQRLAICAGKTTDGLDCYATADDGPHSPRIVAMHRLKTHGLDLMNLPFGKVVGTVLVCDAINCPPLESEDPGEFERALGDWSDGRWCWSTVDARALSIPIPVTGKQGLFDLPTDVDAAIHKQLGSSA